MMIGDSGQGGQDFEINLAPIIDCFTVLIAFMLVSASFLSLGILDAGVSASGESSATAIPPEESLTIEVRADHSLQLKVLSRTKQTAELEQIVAPATSGQSDADALGKQLTQIKSRWPSLAGATLTAQADVEYKDVVQSMDRIRQDFPAVLLGGF